jgi:hypothetical protein
MSLARRWSFSRLTVALVVCSAATLAASPARAQYDHWRAPPRRVEPVLGAVVAGALIGAAVGVHLATPSFRLELHSYGPPPPPPPPVYRAAPYYVPPPCCYQPPPPPPAYVPPPAVVYQPAPIYRPAPTVGLAVDGLFQAPQSGQMALAGAAAALQVRTSPLSLFALEVQSLNGHRIADDTRRNDLAGLVAGRLYFWNAPLVPYLDIGAGLGRTLVSADGLEVHASQVVGRAGLGLELRLGRHVVLQGQVAQVHQLRVGDVPAPAPAGAGPALVIGRHERSTELRGGLALRF